MAVRNRIRPILILLGPESCRKAGIRRDPPSRNLLRSKVIRPLIKQWSRRERKETSAAIVSGIVNGMTVAEIVRELRSNNKSDGSIRGLTESEAALAAIHPYHRDEE
jgi:hypothetical protein